MEGTSVNLLAGHRSAVLLFGNCLGPLLLPEGMVQVQNWVNMKVQIGGKMDGANGELPSDHFLSWLLTPFLCPNKPSHAQQAAHGYWGNSVGTGWGVNGARCVSSVPWRQVDGEYHYWGTCCVVYLFLGISLCVLLGSKGSVLNKGKTTTGRQIPWNKYVH